jgi:hypothetical protein
VARWPEVCRLFANPADEALDVGMGGERFEGVVFAFESFFVEQGGEMIVAGAAEPGDAMFDFFALEIPFVAFVGVAGARDEMMAGE